MIDTTTKTSTRIIINQFIQDHFQFPSKSELLALVDIPEKLLVEIMDALFDDGILDKTMDWYQLSMKTEKNKKKLLSKNAKIYQQTLFNFPNIAETNLGHETTSDTESTIATDTYIIEEKKKKNKYRTQQKKENKSNIISTEESTEENFLPVYIIKYGMALIGISASIISIYYTSIFLMEYISFTPLAILSSATIVIFSVMSFEVIILFLSKKIIIPIFTRAGIIVIAAILWVTIVFFSMGSTIAGQYNKHVLNLKAEAKAGISTGKMQWRILQERKEELLKRQAEFRLQITTLNKIMGSMSDVKTRTENGQIWMENQWRIQKANDDMLRIETDLEKIREQEHFQLEESKKSGVLLTADVNKEILDFYGWMASVTGKSRDIIQFFMGLFFAVFVDILAPAATAVALFLRKK